MLVTPVGAVHVVELTVVNVYKPCEPPLKPRWAVVPEGSFMNPVSLIVVFFKLAM
jgi:hypothetical protein